MQWSLLHLWMSNKLLWISLIKVRPWTVHIQSKLEWNMCTRRNFEFILQKAWYVTYHTSWLFP